MKTAVLVTIAAVITLSSGLARAEAPTAICIGTQGGGLGAPRIDLTLSVVPARAFFAVSGQVRFTQPVSPPGSEVIYGVSGTAIPNADGYWVSLVGTGYDLAKTVFVGMLGLQLSTDPAKNTLTYAKQSLDAATTQLVTRVPVIQDCPTP